MTKIVFRLVPFLKVNYFDINSIIILLFDFLNSWSLDWKSHSRHQQLKEVLKRWNTGWSFCHPGRCLPGTPSWSQPWLQWFLCIPVDKVWGKWWRFMGNDCCCGQYENNNLNKSWYNSVRWQGPRSKICWWNKTQKYESCLLNEMLAQLKISF